MRPTEAGGASMRMPIVMLAALGALALAGPAVAGTKTIDIKSTGFSPKSTTITQNDTVTWVNRDTVNHQVYADKGQFVSPILKPRQSWSFTFNAAGTYTYSDELHPKLKATLYVKGLPPSLTLTATTRMVVFGDKVTLSGVVSNHQAGEQVTIFYQPYPQPNLIQRTVVLTTTGGVYSFVVGPQILTTYQATWKGAFATPTTVQVQPRLTIGRNNGWVLHAYAGKSFAGREVLFQRLNPLTGQWVTLRKVMLGRTSGAKIVLKMPKGMNHLRLAMSVNQAGAGYLGTYSPVLNWRQR